MMPGMNLRLALFTALLGLSLSAFCTAQERFESGWLKGFTKSPTEHIINELDQPFTVRSVKGVVLDQGGFQMPGVLLELQDANGKLKAEVRLYSCLGSLCTR